MIEPTSRQRSELTHTLKAFAFEESPQFLRNQVQSMSVERTFEINDHWRKHDEADLDINDINDTEMAECPMLDEGLDTTRFRIGFMATRYAMADSKHPAYTFDVWTSAERFILPCELRSDNEDEWRDLYSELTYEDDDEDMAETDIDALKLIIENELSNSTAECTQYMTRRYEFDSIDGGIQYRDESGYTVDGEEFGSVIGRLIDDPTQNTIAENQMLQTDDPDEFVINIAFSELVKGFARELQANGNIMPHEQKVAEILFLVDCLKKRELNLRQD